MSQSSPSFTDSALPDTGPVATVARIGELVRAPIEAVAFWAAVILPFVYLPLLAIGLKGETLLAFVVLLGANALSLLIGHSHRRES